MDRNQLVARYLSSHQSLFRAWKTHFFKVLTKEDLSPALMGILLTIQRMQPVSGREIAEEMRITKGAVAQFVETLHQLGLVERDTDVHDRRISHVSLSRHGTVKLRKLEKARNGLITELTEKLSDAELKQAISINEKILQELEK